MHARRQQRRKPLAQRSPYTPPFRPSRSGGPPAPNRSGAAVSCKPKIDQEVRNVVSLLCTPAANRGGKPSSKEDWSNGPPDTREAEDRLRPTEVEQPCLANRRSTKKSEMLLVSYARPPPTAEETPRPKKSLHAALPTFAKRRTACTQQKWSSRVLQTEDRPRSPKCC